MAITCFDFASFLYRISPIFFISVFQQQRAPMPLPNSFRVIGRRPEFKPSSGSPTTSGPVLEAFSPPKNHCHQLALPIGKTKKSYNKTLFLKRERPSIGENIQPEPVIITSRPTRFRGPVNLYSSPSRRACNQKGKKTKQTGPGPRRGSFRPLITIVITRVPYAFQSYSFSPERPTSSNRLFSFLLHRGTVIWITDWLRLRREREKQKKKIIKRLVSEREREREKKESGEILTPPNGCTRQNVKKSKNETQITRDSKKIETLRSCRGIKAVSTRYFRFFFSRLLFLLLPGVGWKDSDRW